MATPDNILSRPIDWRDPGLWPMLDELQGNILKGHGRDHTINHFLRFDGKRIADVKRQIRAIGTQVTSALRQLNEVEAKRLFDRPGGTAIFFFLSAAGYAKLGLKPPPGDAFAQGMAKRMLGDPAAGQWEAHLRPGIDALLIVGDDSVTKVANAAAGLTRGFAAGGITIIGTDAGHAIRSARSKGQPKGRGIEHFGYVDGRSQPLMLADDIRREKTENGGTDKWNPGFGPDGMVLVADPNGTTKESYGTFLVYRKLEQDVKHFKAREKALAEHLKLVGDDDERAGAMVVGRFEDGTPLTLFEAAQDLEPVPNNFTYADDAQGLKCPIHAHVRKVNPRAESAEQRSHLMPRRGIPYGDPHRDFQNEATFPTGGVGLLFMACNKEIERQFEVTQQFWANDFTFPDGTAKGRDPIIGQGTGQDPAWRPGYDKPGGDTAFPFQDFVHMRGGEYFFAPSRGFLKTIA